MEDTVRWQDNKNDKKGEYRSFILNSHSINPTFPVCTAACLDFHLNLQVQLKDTHQICEEPVVALFQGNCLVWRCVFKFDLFIDFKDLENYWSVLISSGLAGDKGIWKRLKLNEGLLLYYAKEKQIKLNHNMVVV